MLSATCCTASNRSSTDVMSGSERSKMRYSASVPTVTPAPTAIIKIGQRVPSTWTWLGKERSHTGRATPIGMAKANAAA